MQGNMHENISGGRLEGREGQREKRRVDSLQPVFMQSSMLAVTQSPVIVIITLQVVNVESRWTPP